MERDNEMRGSESEEDSVGETEQQREIRDTKIRRGQIMRRIETQVCGERCTEIR